jgi:hypothetical protein
VKIFSLSLFTLGAFSLFSCANMGQGSRVIRFQDNVTVSYPNGREMTFKAGETLSLGREPVKIEAPGQVGVLIVPLPEDAGVSDLKLRRISQWTGPEIEKDLDQRLNRIMGRVIEAQRALSRRSGRESLSIIEELENQNSGLTYLNFLKASSYMLLGDREGARRAVEAGLESFPDDRAGRELLRSLGNNR